MEQLVYKAKDWGTISSDMDSVRPFTHHLRNKSKAAADHFGPDHPFAEIVTPDAALDIRKIAHLKGIEEAPGVEDR
jgi:hypothetical protein